MSRPDPAYALSAEAIEQFVDEGVLLMRGCFSSEAAHANVRSTFDERVPVPRLGRSERELRENVDLGEMDFRDSSTWGGRLRLDLSTGRRLPIETFAPRLWGAIRSLIGAERPIARQTMGEQWILKGRFPDPSVPSGEPSVAEPSGDRPLPDLTLDYVTRFRWHIDTPSERTTLDGRVDALVLLILWSDVAPGGGGPLFSGQSLDHVVRLLEAHPEGIDTRGDFGVPIVRACGDIRELTGRAGDVLITHPFALHSAQNNHSGAVRILENPTITVRDPLRYHSDADAPSPVERALIRRLARPRPRPHAWTEDAAQFLIEHHADYFLPGRQAWNARVTPEERRAVRALDQRLTCQWVSEISERVKREQDDPLRRAEAAIAEVRERLVTQRAVRAELRESISDADFGSTTWARLLRGLVSCEGQNHLLGLLLARMFDEVHMFDTFDPDLDRSVHCLLHVRDEAGWFFADAWCEHPIFHLRDRFGRPYPGTPEYDELSAHDPAGAGKMFSRSVYQHGFVIHPRLRAPQPETQTSVPRSEEPAATPTPWQSFLSVRAKEVLKASSDLAAAYGELASRHRFGGATLEVIEVLTKRHRRSGSR